MRRAAVIAATALLALPAAAAAKEVSALELCGTDGCTPITDRAVLRAFEQGSELAAAAPSGVRRSYLIRVHIRDESGAPKIGWTNLWLPSAHVIAFDDGRQGATFTPVTPAFERVLRRAARGHAARAARRFSAPPAPVARVAEVVPAPAAAKARAGGPPALMWMGGAVFILLAAGLVRARRH
jgi:hypothetical protein